LTAELPGQQTDEISIRVICETAAQAPLRRNTVAMRPYLSEFGKNISQAASQFHFRPRPAPALISAGCWQRS